MTTKSVIEAIEFFDDILKFTKPEHTELVRSYMNFRVQLIRYCENKIKNNDKQEKVFREFLNKLRGGNDD